MVRAFTNDHASMKVFTHTSKTLSILFAAFFVGYSYARLSRDEFTRRMMYTRYSNGMLIFDSFAEWFEPRYERIKSGIITFD